MQNHYTMVLPCGAPSRRAGALVSLLLFAVAFGLYLASLSPSLSTQSDSGELVTAASTAGIAHPPGYPLFTMAGYLFSRFPAGDMAFRLNLLSALFSSLAVVFAFQGALLLLGDLMAAAAVAMAMAFSRTFWSLSLSWEVFSLHILFVSLLIYLVLHMRGLSREGEDYGKPLFLFFFILGLSLSHHHTILFLFPAFGFILWAWKLHKPLKSARGAMMALILFAAGLLPYLYLPLRAAAAPQVNWGDPSTVDSFIRVVTRAGYGTFSLAQLSGPSLSPGNCTAMLLAVGKLMLSQTTFLVLPLAVTGIWALWRSERMFLFFLLYMIAVNGPLVSLISCFPCQEGYLAVLERFFLPSILGCAFLCGAGILLLSRARMGPLPSRVPALFFMAALLVSTVLSFSTLTRHRNYIAADYGVNVLNSLPGGALLFVQGDVAAGALLYSQNVCAMREDVILVFEGLLRSPWYTRQLALRHRELSFIGGCENQERRDTMLQIIGRLRESHPVYLNHPVDDPGVVLENRGLVYRVAEAVPIPDGGRCREVQELLDETYSYRGSCIPAGADFFSRELLSLYGLAYCQQALRCKAAGDREGWLGNAKKALSFDPAGKEALEVCSGALVASEQWELAEKALMELLKQEDTSRDAWVNLAIVYARTGRTEKAREALKRARCPGGEIPVKTP